MLNNITVALITVVVTVAMGVGIYVYDQEQQKVAPTTNTGGDSLTNNDNSLADALLPKRSLDYSTNFQGEYTDSEIEYEYSEEYSLGGWIPYWNGANGLLSAQTNQINYISPVWYGINEDGSLIDRKTSNFDQILAYGREDGVELTPTVANFEADTMREALGDPENRNRLIEELLTEIDLYDYDGIDVDIESTYETEKLEFIELIKTLSKELDERDKVLSIAVLSQWDDEITYPSLPQTRRVQDYEILGEYVDQFRIMTYDYSGPFSAEAGPIAPIVWQRDVLNYAVARVPREKIWLGIHLYGYEWNEDGYTRSLTYDQASDIKSREDTVYEFNDDYKEGVMTYPCGDSTCTAYIMDKESVASRIELIRNFGIAGGYAWSLGNDGDMYRKL